MHFIILIYLLFTPALRFAQEISLEIPHSESGSIKNFAWNGIMPLSLPESLGEFIDISLIQGEKEYPLFKWKALDIENNPSYFYRIEQTNLITNQQQIQLRFNNQHAFFLFKNKTFNIKLQHKIPNLNLISATDTITHGGAGVIVLNSEKSDDLAFIALLDSGKVPFYPQTFLKDGYYSILFPWYSDYSNKDWDAYTLVVMDKSGNTNSIKLSSVSTLTRNFRERKIILPNDYAQQKAKELNLDKEASKKLEGNITEINKVLAQQATFNRWKGTRTNFQASVSQKITKTNFFSKPALPMKDARYTAYYGDQRKYYYRNKLSRTSIHRGIDFASVQNAPVYALLDGTVIYADWYSGNGISLIIDHGMQVYTMYAHNSKLLVKAGDKVKAGQQIAISGTTGQSTGDHLHLSVIAQGIYLEPEEWLSADSIDKLIHTPLSKAREIILKQ